MSPEVLAADIAQHNVASTTPLGRDLVARTRRPSSPPVPIVPSCPLAGASRQHLVVVAFELRSVETPSARRRRAASTAAMLDWLSGSAGQDWPERWASSGAETRGRDWFPRTGADRGQMTQGLATLLCLRVLRPGYRWLLGERFLGLWSLFGEVNDPAGFTRLNELSHLYDPHAAAEAVHALIRVMVHTGKPIAALEPADLLAYVEVVTATKQPNAMHVAWLLLHDIGVLGDNAPASLHAARGRGQRSVVEMVDSYGPTSRAVRDVFVDYLTERSASLDYSSLRVLSSRLVGVFWCDIERLAPGIGTLRVDPVLARRWKQDLNTLQRGGPRLDADAVLMSVRAFYADIAQWALAEPHIWAQWAAPNPVSGADLRGYAKHVRHRQARMHHRTRALAPVLSALGAATHARLSAAQGLLAAAQRVGEGEQFAFAERPWHRLRRSRTGAAGAHRPYSQVRVIDTNGAVLDVTTEEADAFWAWAIIEVLRLTGLRVEEMLELTHLSLRRYVRETGDVVPLLQVAPSKTDAERVVPISPELLRVMALIVGRVTGTGDGVPLAPRFDEHEKLWGSPLPHLFQRPARGQHAVFSSRTVQNILDRAVAHARLVDVDGAALRFTPHDFRRIPELREALRGRSRDHHALLVRLCLDHARYLEAAIAELDAQVDQVMAPFVEARDHLDTITGVGKRAAECIIAEIGADMTRFPTAGHLSLWAGMAPGNNITGGKRQSGKTTKGNVWLADILNQCAWCAARSRNTYLSAQYWRLARRIGKKKAAVAVGHSILVICWHLLSSNADYDDLGGDYFIRRGNTARHQDHLVEQLQDLGYHVTLRKIAA